MGLVSAIRARAKRAMERAEALRRERGSVDAFYLMVDRDGEVAGGLMSGALAYRIFLWLLPFALVVVGGIGVAASAASQSTEDAAKSVGLRGLVSSSVAEAAQGSSKWYALLIGIPVLIWATRSLVRAIVGVHRLVWGDPRRSVPKVSIGRSVQFLALLVGYFALRELARVVGSWSGSVILQVMFGCAVVFGWWLLVSARMPHRDATTLSLVPGAIVMAVGLELLSILGTYVITPRVESSQSTDGTLGVAATLLFGLFVVSRLVVASAVLNATLWERRSPVAAPVE